MPPAIGELTPQTPRVTEDMLGYSNKDFHFSLVFPKNLTAKEYQEATGALIVTFEDPKTNEGFQVGAVPFSGTMRKIKAGEAIEPAAAFFRWCASGCALLPSRPSCSMSMPRTA